MGAGGGGGGTILGASNPFTGAGAALEYMGRGYWGGWSGIVVATNGADGALFSFTSPTQALDVTMCVTVNKDDISGNQAIGWRLSLDNIEVARFNTGTIDPNVVPSLDVDPVYFIIPSRSIVLIEATCTDTDDIGFSGLIRAREI